MAVVVTVLIVVGVVAVVVAVALVVVFDYRPSTKVKIMDSSLTECILTLVLVQGLFLA